MFWIIRVIIFSFILFSCTNDRDLNVGTVISTSGDYDILHIWDFNQGTSMDGLLICSFSYDFGVLDIESSSWDVSDGTLLNSFGDIAGNSLRIRNPSEYMDIRFSTKGYGDINISYACMRTNNGSRTQMISYSNDGFNFSQLGLNTKIYEPLLDWDIFEITMDNIPSAFNEDLIIVRISFLDGNSGSSGNNRFDNIIIKGRKISN